MTNCGPKMKARQAAVRTEMARDESGQPLNRAHRAQHLLSGLLVCGECGAPYVMVDSYRYGCNRHRSKARCCFACASLPLGRPGGGLCPPDACG